MLSVFLEGALVIFVWWFSSNRLPDSGALGLELSVLRRGQRGALRERAAHGAAGGSHGEFAVDAVAEVRKVQSLSSRVPIRTLVTWVWSILVVNKKSSDFSWTIHSGSEESKCERYSNFRTHRGLVGLFQQ